MVLKILDYVEESFPYELRDIAETKEVGLALNTARAYLTKVLPPSCVQKKGDKKGTRYNENTLNSFIVLKMLLDKKVLKKDQITAVLEALGQKQINRIALGLEPLKVHVAIEGEIEETIQPDSSLGGSVKEQVLLVNGTDVTNVDVRNEQRLSRESSQDDEWDVLPISDSIQLRYRGELTNEQQEELRIAARMLKAVIQTKE